MANKYFNLKKYFTVFLLLFFSETNTVLSNIWDIWGSAPTTIRPWRNSRADSLSAEYFADPQAFMRTHSFYTITDLIGSTTQSSITPDEVNRSCLPSMTVYKEKQLCVNDLIFEDNFDTAINTEIWQHEIRMPLETEGAEFLLYQKYHEICYVRNGKLYVRPRLANDFSEFNEIRMRSGEINLSSNCTGTKNQECFRSAGLQTILPPVVSSNINTRNSFSFKYGRIEIRAKFPKGDWIFPQLYLEPMEHAYGSTGYASGQMRVGFIRGNEFLESKDFVQINGNRLSGGLILSPQADLRDLWMETILSDKHYGNSYHNYSLTWTNETISVAVDGNTYANYKSSSFVHKGRINNIPYVKGWAVGESMAPFDRKFYLSLGVGVGGMTDFPDNCLNGITNNLKPWNNNSPKAEFKFWLDRGNWFPTWKGSKSALKVDYVKVWAV